MTVHAHPDDEATSTGGILARYAAEGIRTVLVTCTDGACGDGPGGTKPGEAGHDRTEVVEVRAKELANSCAILGIDHVELLGYADSGMMGWPENEAPGSFWGTPVEEPTARLAALMETYRPDVVVTYDDNGFYGHPDHIQANRITMAAAQATGIPAKLYWTTIPQSRMGLFAQRMRDAGVELPELPEPPSGPAEAASEPAEPDGPSPTIIGSPDEEIGAWVDVGAYTDSKYDALVAHSSQADNIFFLRMGREVFAELMGQETFLRVFDRTGAPVPEDDLFAGLR